MKSTSLWKRIVPTLACVVLILNPGPVRANNLSPARVGIMTANAGVTVAFAPTSDPHVSTATVTGVIQNSLLGACVDSAELEARFPVTADQPVLVNGTATWTTIDGANSLKLTVSGSATPDPANPGFYNAKYQITITGGTGAYADAKGFGEITEVVMFTSPSTATTTWNMKGVLVTPR